MATALIFLCNSGVHVEPVKTFVLNDDDFEEANKARNTGDSRGSQWSGGEIEPRTCVAAMKLQDDSCTVADSSGASDWPKSTFTVQVLLRRRGRGV